MSAHRTARSPASDSLGGLLRPANRDQEWLVGALVAAACVHGLLLLRLSRISARPGAVATDVPTEMVEIDVPKPEVPPPVEAPKVEDPPAPALPAPAAPHAPARDTPPPPAAAQAGAVLTKQPEPNEPIDLGDGFMTGTAATYAGGATLSNGASTSAVRGLPAPSGIPGGAGSAPAARAPAPRGPDLSRPPMLEGRSEWRCPFPPEADEGQIDHAVVTLAVSVDSTGRVTSIAVASDAGHGFGREAKTCASGRRWTPAVDHDGSPIPGKVLVNVRFDR